MVSSIRAEDVIEVRLSTLRVRQPSRFGDCWAGGRLWQELGLDAFWREQLCGERGTEPWEKVLELLAVNRLLDPRSEPRPLGRGRDRLPTGSPAGVGEP